MSTPEPAMEIETVGVVGSGAMGRGIAESCLRSGTSVLLHDASEDVLRSARKHIEEALHRSVDKNLASEDQVHTWLERLITVDTLAPFTAVDLVIEAVPEVPDIKLEVLRRIEESVSERAVIASNTSSISITRLSSALSLPSRFLGLHFFNPVPRMKLVEIIPTILTSARAAATVELYVREQLLKTPLTITDRPGFAVNALLIPYLLSAARMLDSGSATAHDIDAGMKLGCGHPKGPLELSDLIGLDVVSLVADSIHTELHDPATVVPNNLRRLVDAGHLGHKTGRGFYEYSH